MALELLAASGKFKDVAMRVDALKRLSHHYPTLMDRWDLIGTSRSSDRVMPASAMDIAVLQAFMKWKVDMCLPAAYYNVCKHYSTVGAMSVHTVPDAERFKQEAIQKGVNRERVPATCLSLETQLTCAIGRDRLMAAQVQKVYAWLWSEQIPVDMCQDRKACGKAIHTISVANWNQIFKITALDKWREEWAGHLCIYCEGHARREHANGREQVWQKLPFFFGLTDWDSLAEKEEMNVATMFEM